MKYSKLTELQGLKFRQIFTEGLRKRINNPTGLNDYLSVFLSEMKPTVPKAWEEAMEKVL